MIQRSNIVWPYRGSQPPVWPFTIDWDNPLSSGLVACYPAAVFPGVPQNLVGRTNVSFTEINTVTRATRPIVNRTYSFARANSERFEDTSNPWITTEPFSFAAWFQVATGTDQNYAILSIGADTNNRADLRLRGAGGDDDVQMSVKGSGTESLISSAISYTIGNIHHAVGICSSDRKSTVFLDGANKNSQAIAAGVLSGIDRCFIGALLVSAVQNHMDGELAFLCVWNRVLTDAEVWQLFDPRTRWNLYYPLRQRVFVQVPAAVAVEDLYGASVMPG